MEATWDAAGEWWVRAALSGGAVLLLGWLGMLAFRTPAFRQRIGSWAVRGAVLAAMLSVLPQWALLPRPDWMAAPKPTEPVKVEAAVEPPPKVEPTPLAPLTPPVDVDSEPVDWVFVPREQLRLTPLPVHEPPAPESVVVPVAPITDSSPPTSVSVVPLLLTAYAVVAGWMLLQLVWERLGLAWLLHDAAPLVGRAKWVFDRLTDPDDRPRAVTSDRIRSPLCVGFFRPLVVVPKRMADSADEATLRWVFAHELDHLRRGDARTAHWVGVARAVFFFVPWFWLIRRDLGLSQEYLADAAATNAGGNPADYAAFLVDLSGGRTSRRPLAAARMRAGKSDLFRRVHMLLNVKTAARRVTRGFTWLAGTAAVVAAVGLSGVGFADEPKKEVLKPAPKPIEAKDVKPLDRVEDEDKTVVIPADLDLPLDIVKLEDVKIQVGDQQEKLKKLKEELTELLKEKKIEEAKKLIEQLDKTELKPVRVPLDRGDLVRPVIERPVLERVERPVIDRPVIERVERPVLDRQPMRLQPPVDVVRQAPRVITGVDSDLRAQYDRQMKEFDEAIKKAKDGEAKEQLEKARDEYKKAMEEPLKTSDAARKELDSARKKLDEAERANRFQNDEVVKRLAEMQKEMQKRLENDFRRFELPINPEDLKRLEGLRLEGLDVGGGMFVPVPRNTTQPRLGVKIEKVSAVLAEQLDLPKDSGMVIVDVTSGSAAEKAGLKKNDVLLKLADKDVPTDPEAFTAMVGKLKTGEKVDAVVLRKGKKESVKGIELPEPKKSPRGDFAPLGGFDGRGGADRGGANNESVQIQINDDEATLKGNVNGTAYTITGTVEKGKLTPSKIVIGEGKEAKEYDSLEKVPEDQRKVVEKLMGKVRVFGGR